MPCLCCFAKAQKHCHHFQIALQAVFLLRFFCVLKCLPRCLACYGDITGITFKSCIKITHAVKEICFIRWIICISIWCQVVRTVACNFIAMQLWLLHTEDWEKLKTPEYNLLAVSES